MPQKPAKSAKSKPAKSAKSAKSKPATTATTAKAATTAASRKRTTRRRKPSHDEIAERAYFIHVEEGGSDELGNWLRAESELTTA